MSSNDSSTELTPTLQIAFQCKRHVYNSLRELSKTFGLLEWDFRTGALTLWPHGKETCFYVLTRYLVDEQIHLMEAYIKSSLRY